MLFQRGARADAVLACATKFALYRCRGNTVARPCADMINGGLLAKCARKYAVRAISCGTHRFVEQ
jgi:hypothetical protein